MRHILTQNLIGQFLAKTAAALLASLLGTCAYAAAPGITGTGGTASTFDLTAQADYISQPDGASVYSWGYGCNTAPSTSQYVPAAIAAMPCPTMQLPGPTLIVHQNDVVTVTLHNNLPAAAGNTSMLFPGFAVTATGGVAGPLAQEALNGGTVTYTFTATNTGTHAYYSGTQADLQIEMGLYGAIIVLPNAVPAETVPPGTPAVCHDLATNLPDGQPDFRLAAAAYNHPQACYDREYLFQFSEMDPNIHSQAETQSAAYDACISAGGNVTTCPGLHVATEPYHPAYFMINGRSMPDDMDPNYSFQYPHQPYNANPHTHPGERVLIRQIGTGRWQHPFHEHANHLRVLARDGNLLLSQTDSSKLAGKLMFTTTSTPGQAQDSMFYWTGRGLNWDAYGHATSGAGSVYNIDPADTLHYKYNGQTVQCYPDANGYYTVASNPPAPPDIPNYYEWCQDHDKALESKPFGQVGAGGPVTLPDPNILTNGAWYGGSAYLGPDATTRATGPTGTTPPSGTVANPPTTEAGMAFMWHSHNEREITTNNIFPGGMMTMLLVDPQSFTINEAN